MEPDIIIKICIVGESGVGKTSMLYQYVFKKFEPKTRPTIGCDFSTKIKVGQGNRNIKLQLWDIAGQQRYNAVSKMYVRGALGCVIVCSAEDKKSVQETLKWKGIIDQNCDYTQDDSLPIPCLLVQNKTDLINSEEIEDFQKKEYLEKFAKQKQFCGVCTTSAKQNKNIEECFQQLLNQIINRGLIKQLKPQTNDNKKLDDNNKKQSTTKKKKCC